MACLGLGLTPATLTQRTFITLFSCLLERRFSPWLAKCNKNPRKDKGGRDCIAGEGFKLSDQSSGELYTGNRST